MMGSPAASAVALSPTRPMLEEIASDFHGLEEPSFASRVDPE